MQTSPDLQPPDRVVYSVSRLNRETRFLLNECFGSLWVEGEISNLSMPASGHLYFTLKDAEAQVRCAMFRPQSRFLAFKPENGLHVVVKAQVSLYEPRGDFQLVAEQMDVAGDGALLQAFEALKRRLAGEGLFAAERKKPLPALPRCIGVITSPTGAAIRDILSVLGRRCPSIPVVVIPAKVQGADAKTDVVRALRLAESNDACDVLIVARGGGSLEDLWTFNEESVARAIAACAIPIVTGIGHEIDFSIADFTADLRAPTPSAAAEAVSPNSADWLERLSGIEARLRRGLSVRLESFGRHLEFLGKRLDQSHPARRIGTQTQRLDELEQRLFRATEHRLARAKSRLQNQTARLTEQRPDRRAAHLRVMQEQLHQRLRRALNSQLEFRRERIGHLGQQLQTVSPLATLARGYSITRRAVDGALVRSCRDVAVGIRIRTDLSDGSITAKVESLMPADDDRQETAEGKPAGSE